MAVEVLDAMEHVAVRHDCRDLGRSITSSSKTCNVLRVVRAKRNRLEKVGCSLLTRQERRRCPGEEVASNPPHGTRQERTTWYRISRRFANARSCINDFINSGGISSAVLC